MDKKNFDNQLRRQCLSLPAMCEDQLTGFKKGIDATIPRETLRDIRKVILTGCGDSYLAARAAVPAFQKYAGAFASSFEAHRCIDVARKMTFDPKYASSTLLIAISASGGPARVEEALRRAKHHGCKTLLITNAPDSDGAKAAEYTMIVNTPEFPEFGPGLRNYYASLGGLFSIAAYMGEAKGLQREGTLEALFDAIRTYTGEFAKALPKLDEQAFETAVAWKDNVAVEAIGDYTDFASAYFISAKFVEVAGMLAATTDSENWCHVNYFAHDPAHIGTVVVSTKRLANFGRVKETMMTVGGIGRPAFLITTGTKEDYLVGDAVTVCTVPEAPGDFGFIEPMLNYIPGALLASYAAALKDEPYFRAADSIHKTSACGHTVKSSKIVIL
ncbi:MAG TPA: SIS domain-containing protein [Clostridia bacterium]|nr:SIS domain-containing protein [Clostridia bacterium]